MLRALVALLSVSSVSGLDAALCAIDSARATDDLLDTMVYIFASIQRCGKSTDKKGIRCALDISSSIESANKMVNVIVKAVDKCGEISTEKPACGIAIGELTRSVAALSAAGAGIVAKCPNDANGNSPLTTSADEMKGVGASSMANENAAGFHPGFGMCLINVKDSVKSLFKAVKRAMVLKDQCVEPHTPECAHNSIKLVDAFVGMAEFISGAVGQCSLKTADRTNGQCAEYAAKLTHAIGDVGVAATALDGACAPTAKERLYLASLDEKKDLSAPATGSLTMGLTALLPVTAVVAFVAGKRLAKARAVQPVSDEEMLMQSE